MNAGSRRIPRARTADCYRADGSPQHFRAPTFAGGVASGPYDARRRFASERTIARYNDRMTTIRAATKVFDAAFGKRIARRSLVDFVNRLASDINPGTSSMTRL